MGMHHLSLGPTRLPPHEGFNDGSKEDSAARGERDSNSRGLSNSSVDLVVVENCPGREKSVNCFEEFSRRIDDFEIPSTFSEMGEAIDFRISCSPPPSDHVEVEMA